MIITEKRQDSGPLREIDFYPTYVNGYRLPSRAEKERRTSKEQAKYNRQQAIKKLIRLVNINFDNTDVLMHPTYCPNCAPKSEEQARRDIVNYLRRVKTRRATLLKETEKALADLPDTAALKKQRERLKAERDKLAAPFKYIYAIERVTYKSGKRVGGDNWHFHLFLTGGVSRRELEEMWPHGMRTNADRFQPERFGPEAAARYISKDPEGYKRFAYSRNLEKPPLPKKKDSHMSKRGVQMLAEQRVDDAAYWEKRYKGYRFIRCFARFNPFNGHWYVSVIMYKSGAGEPPPWNIEDWMEE